MGTRQLVLTVIFAAHWLGFFVLLMRDRRVSLLLPIAVFTLLILTQIYWDSSVNLDFGAFGSHSLPVVLRVSAIALAVPSIGLMARRIVLRRRKRVAAEAS